MRLSINVQATPAWGCSGWKVPFATYSYMQRTFTACSQRTRCANCVSGFYAAQRPDSAGIVHARPCGLTDLIPHPNAKKDSEVSMV